MGTGAVHDIDLMSVLFSRTFARMDLASSLECFTKMLIAVADIYALVRQVDAHFGLV